MKHTFASSSRHSTSCRPPFVVLSICAYQKNLQEHLQCENIFVLRAIHFSIGHFLFIGIFVLKTASSRTPAIFVFPDAWSCNYRSTSILG
jgi:hypothetical protein